MLAAGLDGVRNKIEPPAPVTGNVYTMSARERSRYKIKSLPANLGEAINQFEKSPVMKEALGEHAFQQFIAAKRAEWGEYIAQVHDWELDRYLSNL
jgi:glutamine synthetase